jgi:Protein kinase domain
MSISTHDEPVLRVVGRYELLREVGRGGTAVVYVARQSDLGRLVALKELAAFHAAKPEVVERFLRESRVTGALNHPNVVTVHEYLEHESTAYIAMEYFERGSLRPWVRRLSLPQVVGVLEGVLAGLAHAEGHGIVHRDLKPENVMVTSTGGVKITDFGIAKALQDFRGRSLTADGTTVGTPAYMAPEQALGTGIGPWTDLYAVGVMAYELLSGDVPFPEDELPLVTLLRHANEPVPPLHDVDPSVAPPLSDWVARMLAKKPEDRPAGAARAWDELEEAAIGVLGSRWRRDARLADGPEDVPERGTRPTVATVPDDGGRTVPIARGRRLRRRYVAGAVVVLAGVAAAVGLAIGLRGTKSPPEASAGKVVADYVPSSSEQLSLAVAGPSLVLADPKGRIVQVDRASLSVRRVLRDPARPRAVSVGGGRVYVADGDGVSARRVGTLAPISVRTPGSASALAAGPLVAASRDGRVCELGRGSAVCGRVGFAPTGLGASGKLVFAAGGSPGRVVVLRRSGGTLVSAGHVAVARPHGQLDFFRGRVYAPSERGIVVVDPRRLTATSIRLPVSPAAIWIAPAGRLYAALPATGSVAIVDTAAPQRAPQLVRLGGRPVALAGAGDTVFVADRSGRITKIDASGARHGSARVLGAGAVPGRAVLGRVRERTASDTTTLVLTIRGGRLDSSGLVVRDGAIADGRATLELWQGAIGSAVTKRSFGDLAVRVDRLPGRLVVRLSASAGAFAGFRARLTRSGVAVELRKTLAPSPPPAFPSPPPAAPQSGGSLPPPPAPPPPHQTTTTPGCCNVG